MCDRSLQLTAEQKEPIVQHDVGDHAWNKVGLDLFNLQGSILLVSVDYYLEYIKVGKLITITCRMLINLLNEWLDRHGIPERWCQIMTDSLTPGSSGN